MKRSSSLTVTQVNTDNTCIDSNRRFSTSFCRLDKRKPHRALRTLFLRNLDQHFRGVVLSISEKWYKEFNILLEALTTALRPHVVLKSAVSKLFRIDGTPIQSLDDFYEGDIVICCCDYENFFRVDYNVNELKVEQLKSRICRHTFKDSAKNEPKLIDVKVNELPNVFRLNFKISGPIWKTNSTAIFKAETSANKRPYILKVVDKVYMQSNLNELYAEITILRQLQKHPNILQLGLTVDRLNFTYIMAECLDCDLYNLAKTHSPISLDTIKLIMSDTARGMLFIHSQQIIHRDLKPENILAELNFDRQGKNPQVLRVKIADFGLATFFKGSELYQWCGTPPYMAPELLSYAGYNFFVDSWALGCTFFFLLFNRTLFEGQCSKGHSIIDCVQHCEHQVPTDQMNKLSFKAEHLLNALLEKSPLFRLSAREICRHPFLR